MDEIIAALGLTPETALAFFRDKLAVAPERYRLLDAAAKARAFSIAGAAGEAMLADFQAALAAAIEEGTSLEAFTAEFEAIAARRGWDYEGPSGWRSRIIFETNLNEAYSAGRWYEQTRAETLEAFPFWEYAHSGALNPREQHLKWDGLVLAATDAFWSVAYPPNGFGCGCFVLPLSPEDMGRMGKNAPDPSPDLATVLTFTRRGTPTEIIRGVDAGFEGRPGGTWLPDMAA